MNQKIDKNENNYCCAWFMNKNENEKLVKTDNDDNDVENNLIEKHNNNNNNEEEEEEEDTKEQNSSSQSRAVASKIIEEKIISSITFGAPSAHCMGFKTGGLRETMNKVTQYSFPTSKNRSKGSAASSSSSALPNPTVLLKQLELRYECRVRESIVTSQAIGGITSAAIELLSRIIYKQENRSQIIQYHRVGLLVHCISLLSTSGHEEGMLDDFAGALERLDITLKFHPPNTCTFDNGRRTSQSGMSSMNSMSSGGGSSVGGFLNSFVGGSTTTSVDSGMRRTDPLNLMSVIKIKPTKPTSSSSSSSSKDELKDRKEDPNSTPIEASVSSTPQVSSLLPQDNYTNDLTSPAMGFLSPTPKISKKKSTREKEEIDDDDDDDNEIGDNEIGDKDINLKEGKNKNVNNASSSNQRNKTQPTKTKRRETRQKSKGVLLGRVTIDIQINSMSSFVWLCESLQVDIDASPTIKILPVLFNLGVNEMQSIANRIGTTDIQTEINRKGLIKMKTYFQNGLSEELKMKKEEKEKHKNKINSTQNITKELNQVEDEVEDEITSTHIQEEGLEVVRCQEDKERGGGGGGEGRGGEGVDKMNNIQFFSSETKKKISLLLNSIEFLVEAVAKEKGKMVDLLLVSSFAGRLLGAARTTSCKSAKDRTSVFHTLEVARLAERWGWLERSQETEFLDELRGPLGVRLQNCTANIGRPMYSFNAVQMKALPKELRPPAMTSAAGEA
eukprot:CAMPEP_0114334392 /NCGR_PEP_ID=MMETSP0101-20121206/4348_1 /TAXON_ID=38822 ORGANISM="Pteridomonas danica, Strain PT" /NCGR_SAMPLE_ID=MMETSP0101 /ASSEMBLY_ACC=CAM_ASM_000211 /LENGTH=728 /DNA_ID=CAMNT_0001465643 /DNA_START=908 /DNA_END=3094 /DNA_ORIENTATION=+